MEKNKKKFYICAPLYILKDEKIYFLWIIIVAFFGLTNIWASLLMGDSESVSTAFSEGIVYTYLISICAPFIAEILISILVDLKSIGKVEFITVKILAVLVDLILILILSYMWIGNLKGSFWFQVILGFIISVFCFYMFCIGRMSSHKAIVSKYDDDNYINKENKNIQNLQKNANKLISIKDDQEGEIKI